MYMYEEERSAVDRVLVTDERQAKYFSHTNIHTRVHYTERKIIEGRRDSHLLNL